MTCIRLASEFLLATSVLVGYCQLLVYGQLPIQYLVSSPSESKVPISYDRQIRPILSEFCFACHGFDKSSRQADFRLDTLEGALHSGNGDAIVPGQPHESQLVKRIDDPDEHSRMPPPESKKTLTDEQRELIREWIQQGAVYDQHWAFVPPRQTLPPNSDAEHPIDSFILSKLEELGIRPSDLAGPETLIRRISLDLRGLPPSPHEIDDFLAESKLSPVTAYAELVERLLASPHYGERFGRWWLDQARYADSNGYSVDAPREIWLYRDWVIRALNQDMPFDQFTLEQIAGDLLSGATVDQLVATGFHRNTQLNKEGGIDPEQFRIESVFDRVATTGTVWLGLTIGCAQCHDHKYDPISQEDYYRLFAFFNNQDEPALRVDRFVDGQIATTQPTPSESPQGTTQIAEGSLVSSARAEAETVNESQTVSSLILSERDSVRETRILIQGDFTRPASAVLPGTPGILHPLQFSSEFANRLDLARWLVDRNNPLTARVIVNRIWQHYFGKGLVESDNDFGSQGSPPSHAELLDWLATYWMESGWSLKQLSRLIVTSHAYRQSSNYRQDLELSDPNNLMLARQARLRLDAELIRDVALTASGLLNSEIGGPSTFPPIPEGVMSLGQVKHSWNTSQGPDRYRRGVYTFVFRATPPPSLNVFDAPDGFQSCTRRMRSNTPLQALTLLNDAGFFEFAQVLDSQIQSRGIVDTFRYCTSRMPSKTELGILSSMDRLGAARVLLNLDETITRE